MTRATVMPAPWLPLTLVFAGLLVSGITRTDHELFFAMLATVYGTGWLAGTSVLWTRHVTRAQQQLREEGAGIERDRWLDLLAEGADETGHVPLNLPEVRRLVLRYGWDRTAWRDDVG